MASGKSLELVVITPPTPEPICVKPDCGLPWSTHLKKKENEEGYHERLKKYESLEHRILGTFVRPNKKLTKAERRAHKRRSR